jgi:hypothetical protein
MSAWAVQVIIMPSMFVSILQQDCAQTRTPTGYSYVIHFGLWLAMVLSTQTHAQLARGGYRLEVMTGRPGGIYSVGQQVDFVVRLSRKGQKVSTGKITYVLDWDGIPRVRGSTEISSNPLVIQGTRFTPGFLGCRVTYQPEQGSSIWAMAAAGIDPLQITPSLPAPRRYWTVVGGTEKEAGHTPNQSRLDAGAFTRSEYRVFRCSDPLRWRASGVGILGTTSQSHTRQSAGNPIRSRGWGVQR